MHALLIAENSERRQDTLPHLERIGRTDVRAVGADSILSFKTYNLFILDLDARNLNALNFLRELRDLGISTPVLVLTSPSATEARIEALNLGADDYLIKPFEHRELEARVRALLRKTSSAPSVKNLRYGNMLVDRSARSLLVMGIAMELTPREFALTEAFVHHRGRVFSKDEIIEQLFGLDDEPTTENAIEHLWRESAENFSLEGRMRKSGRSAGSATR